MACRTESKDIDGHKYSVTQWPVDKSLLMKFKLGKVLGPAFNTLTEVMDKKSSEEAMVQGIIKALGVVFEKNDPQEVTDLIKTVVVGAARDGEKITDTTYTQHFSGDEMSTVYKVFIFVLKVNYGNLFKGQLVERLLAKAPQNLSTQQTSQT